jgi:hypothetical protein
MPEQSREHFPLIRPGCTIKCVLDCDANTFAYAVDGGVPEVVFEGLPAGRALYPAVFVEYDFAVIRVLEPFYFLIARVGLVLRARVMCQAGRCHAASAPSNAVAWLCERAPLWVVVHVCALLRLE